MTLFLFHYKTYLHTHYLITKNSILGTLPNVARNCIINVGEIVVYDIVKEMILNKGLLEDGIPCHFSAAATAGFTATLVASPVDVVKTRYDTNYNPLFCGANINTNPPLFTIKINLNNFYRFMNSPKGRYKGALSCAIETAKHEGLMSFYKGFNASFTRLVSWNICLWLTYEQFKKIILAQYETCR